MKRVLVTGGAGFLGSFIADELAERGHEVRIFDRRPSEFLRPGQEMRVGDILDSDSITAASENCDAVFHLAGLADLDQAHGRPRLSAELNVVGCINALEAAHAAGAKRFLLASTVYVYSRAGGFYRCSKQAAEAFVEEFSKQNDFPFTILRFGSLYGPRCDDSNGVYRLLRQAFGEASVDAVGTPEDAREYIHVSDAARLSVDALAEEFAGEHLVLTGHHKTRLRDLFVMFSEILGREVEVKYHKSLGNRESAHYRMTPYSYTPRVGRKLTARHYVDMGQGLLQLIHELADDGQTAG